MLIILAIITLVVVAEQASSYTETYVSELCFTTPAANETRSFSETESWCSEHNSALAVVNDSYTQMALAGFMNSSNITDLAYINIKLKQQGNTWFLVNGSAYEGKVGNQENLNITYTLYGLLVPDTNFDFTVRATNPNDLNRYICSFEDVKSFSNTTSNFIFNNIRYTKYDRDAVTWYQARERCIINGGNLAQFQSVSNDKWSVPFLKSKLSPSLFYWAGIRWNDWKWTFPESDKEVIYYSWSQRRPSNYNNSCVCADPHGSPAWSWTDCDCSMERPFVCLKTVPTTTLITTTPMTKESTRAAPSLNTNSSDSTKQKDQKQLGLSKSQIIGLGAGIGGGCFILLIVVIIIVAVVVMRRKRKRMEESESRAETQHNGGSLGKEQKPPRKPINNTRGKDVYAQVNKPPRNPANNDVYAKVVSGDNKQQTNNIETSPEIVYSAPGFAEDQKSAPTDSAYEVANRVKEPDAVPSLRGQIKSIFPVPHNNAYDNDTEYD